MNQENVDAQRLACYRSLSPQPRKSHVTIVYSFLLQHPEVTPADREEMYWLAKQEENEMSWQALKRRLDKYRK